VAANADIYFEHDRWGRALAWSAGLHVGITSLLLIYSAVFYGTSGQTWGAGGGGEAAGVMRQFPDTRLTAFRSS